MIKIIQMETKNIIRSKIYFFFLTVNVLIAIVSAWAMSSFDAANNFYRFYGVLYFELLIAVSSFAFSSFMAGKQNTIANVCFIHAPSAFIGKYLTVFILQFPVCMFSVIYNLCGIAQYEFDLSYTFSAVWVHGIRTLTALFIFHTFGYILGYLIKNPLCVLLSVPTLLIFSFFNESLFSFFNPSVTDESIITSLLTTNVMYLGTRNIGYAGPIYDILDFVKSLFFLFMCLTLILFTCTFIAKKRKITYSAVSVIMIIACTVSVFAFIEFSPQSYVYAKEAVLYPESPNSTGDYIEKCHGSIDLGQWSDFSIDIKAVDKNADGKITFSLDKCFKIESFILNGKEIQYKRDGNTVSCEAEKQNEISLKYCGRAYYKTDIYGYADVFTMAHSACFPVGFAFVPLTGYADVTSYDLTVNAQNTVVSNLDYASQVTAEGVTFEKVPYRLTGESSTVAIFCGYFESFDYNGIPVYTAKYDYLSDYAGYGIQVVYTARKMDYIPDEGKDPLTEVTEEELASIKKIFLIDYACDTRGFPCFFDNVVYRNYCINRN